MSTSRRTFLRHLVAGASGIAIAGFAVGKVGAAAPQWKCIGYGRGEWYDDFGEELVAKWYAALEPVGHGNLVQFISPVFCPRTEFYGAGSAATKARLLREGFGTFKEELRLRFGVTELSNCGPTRPIGT